ncbi:hypothetical protein N7492_008446 [Penicillium capsulatum]|uniref:Uncharacterized protein n=1 Tax=Penicillium capsulatum TaxID=69766 RepID=A0A9W9HS58_9EURO|nr:hypothetical protein N7492_008446 [Penicillium capsulatum]KAJ6105848.1 hypothetical protein N7512_009365 [Penicillium capsulatum]
MESHSASTGMTFPYTQETNSSHEGSKSWATHQSSGESIPDVQKRLQLLLRSPSAPLTQFGEVATWGEIASDFSFWKTRRDGALLWYHVNTGAVACLNQYEHAIMSSGFPQVLASDYARISRELACLESLRSELKDLHIQLAHVTGKEEKLHKNGSVGSKHLQNTLNIYQGYLRKVENLQLLRRSDLPPYSHPGRDSRTYMQKRRDYIMSGLLEWFDTQICAGHDKHIIINNYRRTFKNIKSAASIPERKYEPKKLPAPTQPHHAAMSCEMPVDLTVTSGNHSTVRTHLDAAFAVTYSKPENDVTTQEAQQFKTGRPDSSIVSKHHTWQLPSPKKSSTNFETNDNRDHPSPFYERVDISVGDKRPLVKGLECLTASGWGEVTPVKENAVVTSSLPFDPVRNL